MASKPGNDMTEKAENDLIAFVCLPNFTTLNKH